MKTIVLGICASVGLSIASANAATLYEVVTPEYGGTIAKPTIVDAEEIITGTIRSVSQEPERWDIQFVDPSNDFAECKDIVMQSKKTGTTIRMWQKRETQYVVNGGLLRVATQIDSQKEQATLVMNKQEAKRYENALWSCIRAKGSVNDLLQY